MKRSTARWTTSLAAAALLGLPAASMAQTPTQPPTTSAHQTTATPQAKAGENADAQEHLRQAKAALDAVAPTAVTGHNKMQLAELKRHLNALEKVGGASANASATGAAKSTSRASAAKVNWSTEVAAADKILTNLLGPAGTTGSATDPTSTTGTSGTAAKKPASAASLDEATRTQLMEVRTHLTAFAAAMSGTSAAPATEPSAASSTSPTTGSTSTTGSMAGATTGSTTGTTDPTSAQDPTAAAQQQVDQEAARRHLTDARDTLSQLTQLPAAAQLSGEARTQVSQLISNFNELITTQSEWRATYAKLEANLNALIGPDNTDAEATGGVSTGTTGTTGTAGATGTAGTAGTTGTTAGVANLDPAVRAKLVELRQKLNAFEKAAGGNVTPASDAAAATTDSTAATTGSTAATGSTATTDPMTSGQTTAPKTGTQATSEAMGHQEAMRHIAAIEAILNANGAGTSSPAAGTTGSATTTGTSGSTTPATGANLTLTSAQLEQLRTHLTELKRLVGEAKK